jgi:beta-lactam-binding protein with PASTA domain
VSNLSGPIQGKAIGTMRPGQYPDFVGADLPSTLSVLYDNGLNFLIVAVRTADTPAGLVMSQSPGPGAKADDNTAITLVVSRAPGAQ